MVSGGEVGVHAVDLGPDRPAVRDEVDPVTGHDAEADGGASVHAHALRGGLGRAVAHGGDMGERHRRARREQDRGLLDLGDGAELARRTQAGHLGAQADRPARRGDVAGAELRGEAAGIEAETGGGGLVVLDRDLLAGIRHDVDGGHVLHGEQGPLQTACALGEDEGIARAGQREHDRVLIDGVAVDHRGHHPCGELRLGPADRLLDLLPRLVEVRGVVAVLEVEHGHAGARAGAEALDLVDLGQLLFQRLDDQALHRLPRRHRGKRR